MAQTAAQKLAARAASAAPSEAPAAPPAAPKPAGPVLADYTLLGLQNPDPASESVWVPLGEVKAATYTHALDAAKDRLRDKIVAAATEEAPAPPTLKLTVAAVASKNWNQGTAIVEMQPVTTWEK